MRAKIKLGDLLTLFGAIRQNSLDKQLPKVLNVSPRTICDWRRGKHRMPVLSFKKLAGLAGCDPKKIKVEFIKDYAHAEEAGRKGGYARLKLHGNPGTPEGRRKGGLASMAAHIQKGTRFSTLKAIARPKYSSKLAELLGIMFGDGHLSDYQASVSIGLKSDSEYAAYVLVLFKDLFDSKPAMIKREKEGAIDVRISSKRVVKFLNKKGMPIGNKIDNNLSIPNWINNKKSYQKAFIRGLFDTDGCVYCDRHRINGRGYEHLGWTITSYADKLIEGIINVLASLGFSPTHTEKQKSVYLRKQVEIKRYFLEIGTKNPKHQQRLNTYQGRVPKWL